MLPVYFPRAVAGHYPFNQWEACNDDILPFLGRNEERYGCCRTKDFELMDEVDEKMRVPLKNERPFLPGGHEPNLANERTSRDRINRIFHRLPI